MTDKKTNHLFDSNSLERYQAIVELDANIKAYWRKFSMTNLCAVSTKTTGLKPGIHEVIEINFRPFNQKEVITFKVKPERLEAYEKHVQEINGISSIVAASFPEKQEVADKILNLFPVGLTLVGHNIEFDVNMIRNTFGRSFLDSLMKDRYIDTMILVEKHNLSLLEQGKLKKFKNMALKTVATELKIPFDHKCNVIFEVFKWMDENGMVHRKAAD